MMNMKLLSFVKPLSIYHGCSTRKTFGEENFTFDEFIAVSIKNCGRCNVRKHREIKDSDKYFTFDISLKFDSLDMMIITYSESKDNWGR